MFEGCQFYPTSTLTFIHGQATNCMSSPHERTRTHAARPTFILKHRLCISNVLVQQGKPAHLRVAPALIVVAQGHATLLLEVSLVQIKLQLSRYDSPSLQSTGCNLLLFLQSPANHRPPQPSPALGSRLAAQSLNPSRHWPAYNRPQFCSFTGSGTSWPNYTFFDGRLCKPLLCQNTTLSWSGTSRL